MKFETLPNQVTDAIVSPGCFLEDCTVENAIIGLRSRVGKGVVIRVRLSPGREGEEGCWCWWVRG